MVDEIEMKNDIGQMQPPLHSVSHIANTIVTTYSKRLNSKMISIKLNFNKHSSYESYTAELMLDDQCLTYKNSPASFKEAINSLAQQLDVK